jgi:hypothetical protein
MSQFSDQHFPESTTSKISHKQTTEHAPGCDTLHLLVVMLCVATYD